MTSKLGKPAAIIINRVQPRTTALAMTRGALTAFDLPICPTPIIQRAAHSYAAATGETVTETEPRGKAAKEITALWGWLSEKEFL
jgi:chromosome partitioning protein